jgi:opine dehydrogenase
VLDRNRNTKMARAVARRGGEGVPAFARGDGAALHPSYNHLTPTHEHALRQAPIYSFFSRRLINASESGVAILGAGHGGVALAAYLAKQGPRVTLWNRSPEPVAAVACSGGIHLTMPGSPRCFARIAEATCNMATAVANSSVILVAVPACAHADIARACVPHLRDGQTVLLLPGRTGGALEFRRTLRAAGCRADVLLGEANTFPLAARRVGPAEATVFGTKDEIEAAALPACRTPELLEKCCPLLPALTAARSVLHTGFGNVGAILHPTILLGNAERIARGDVFDFYTEGVTPRVGAVLAAADAERLSVAHAYGVAVPSIPRWIAAAYNHQASSMIEAVGGNPAYVGIKAPTTLNHRYLLEDVPTGLCPMLSLGHAAGLTLPTLTRLANLARQALGGENWQRTRTVDSLGLNGLSPVEIRVHVEHYRSSANVSFTRNRHLLVG